MANAKLTALTALAEAPNDADLVYLVDTSDTTDGASGTGKKITAANLKSGLVAGTLVTTVGATGTDTNVPSEQAVREAIAAIPGGGDIKADGSVSFTGIESYDTHKTFTTDTSIVDKKYVDDAITVAGGYTDENAQDAVGGILTDTSTVDFTYNDAAGQITADVKDASITLAKQANLAQSTIIGRVTASTGVPEALTATNVRTIINVADGATANSKATSAEITTGTDDVKFATAKAIKDAGIVATPTKAAGSDVTTGTDDAKYVTSKAIKDAGITADLTYTSPGSDHSGSGIKTSITAGETTTIGQIAYIKSDGKAWLAKADATSTMPACVIALGSYSANTAYSYLVRGIVRDDSWSWTVGGLLYVSAATTGAMTQTAPTGTGKQVQVVGVALSATTIMFMPNMMVLELA